MDEDGSSQEFAWQRFCFRPALPPILSLPPPVRGWLRDEDLPASALGEKVEEVTETGPVDGMMFDLQGRLYLSDLEGQAIRRVERSGEIVTIVRDQRLNWPDTFAVTSRGEVFVTTSQISEGESPPAPYRIFRLRGGAAGLPK